MYPTSCSTRASREKVQEEIRQGKATRGIWANWFVCWIFQDGHTTLAKLYMFYFYISNYFHTPHFKFPYATWGHMLHIKVISAMCFKCFFFFFNTPTFSDLFNNILQQHKYFLNHSTNSFSVPKMFQGTILGIRGTTRQEGECSSLLTQRP